MHAELAEAINANYSIDYSDAVPVREGLVLHDGDFSYLLKKEFLSIERICFNHLVKEHLAKEGFPYTDRYIQSNSGEPYFIFQDDIFTISYYLRGKDCNFDSSIDLAKAASALAAMHTASVGTECPDKYIFAKRDLGMMPKIFQHRVDELKRFKKIARKGKSQFDYIFLKVADIFIDQGEKALFDLNNSQYTRLIEKCSIDNSICHHDFTQHNIVIADNISYIKCFDNCCVEIKEYDIANFLRRKMRKCSWDLTDAKYMLDNYRSVCEISESEFEVLKIILNFPQKLWRIVNKYYNSKRSWCEKSCLDKIKEVMDEAGPLKLFIDNFDLLY